MSKCSRLQARDSESEPFQTLKSTAARHHVLEATLFLNTLAKLSAMTSSLPDQTNMGKRDEGTFIL